MAQFNLQIYGHIPISTTLHPKLKPHYHGQSWGEHSVKIYNASKIILNFVPDHMPVGGNLRTFEIPACRAFQLANRTDPAWFKSGKEIELFSSHRELISKIKLYLSKPSQRKSIAQAGYKRVLKQHTLAHRFNQLFNLLDVN